MNRSALKLLKRVSKQHEISLADAIRMAKSDKETHLGQYPLALLIEDGYVGCTINHCPPEGAEQMREHCLATLLHILALPKDANGLIKYGQIYSSGNINPQKEWVFIKAKGALYLEEHAQRHRDRLWSFSLGFIAGVVGPLVSAWIKGFLTIP